MQARNTSITFRCSVDVKARLKSITDAHPELNMSDLCIRGLINILDMVEAQAKPTAKGKKK
jgi:hypothetical protein